MNPAEKRLLVVDDTIFMATMIQKTLETSGYNVEVAHSGEEALEKIRDSRPDLILLDVIMPGMSGFDVCEALRGDARFSLIPIIIITGQTAEEDKLKGLELGADDYVVKPFVKRELLARVHNTLVRLERMREVNPMTGLPGNNEIEAEMQKRVHEEAPYAVMYFDLNLFKPYNDVYGFASGDNLIRLTADIIVNCVADYGSETDFVGHIGGDDFIAIVSPEGAVPIAEAVIAKFDTRKLAYYTEEDLQKGYISSQDRNGLPQHFGLTGIAIAIVMSERHSITDTRELAKVAAGLKSKAKHLDGSGYAISE